MKKLLKIHRESDAHWVGDGFPVRTIFSYADLGAAVDPFLLMDYAGPARFERAEKPRGIGFHPHRGFETVTIVYQGEIEHGDTAGNKGRIGPGDVQWMTAASGVLHEEMHSLEFAKQGGVLQMIQLWVNLPAKDKMSAPRYQGITSGEIPTVELVGGSLRVIAGEFSGTKGPASTFTPVNLWDIRLKKGAAAELNAPEGFTCALFVLEGTVCVNGSEETKEAELASFDRAGAGIAVEAREDSLVLVLASQPIGEPVAGYGPFVMNTREEIRKAREDYENGRIGTQILP
ncbi:MAG: pirin family protein [Candidatus Omnitrophota bacterium]|nr:pirin family protein [Candidatus Omnitrophota bacterium]